MSVAAVSRAGCLLLVVLALLSCISWASEEEREFLRLSDSERRAAINDYPADQRVRLYVSAMDRVHPADLELADALAQGGASVVPHIADKLRNERRDSTKTFLIYALLRMQELSTYSVGSDRDLMRLIAAQTHAIKSGEWRQMATGFADSISQNALEDSS